MLQVVGQNALDDHSVVLDRVWPVLGPHEVRSDSFPWFAHGTRSGIASSIIGSTAHELGHAFGLLHTYANDGLWRHRNLGPGAAVHYGTLMGNGFRAWRSWREAGAFSSPASPEYLRLAPASADLLALSPFFGGSDTSFDPTPPVIAAPPETRIDEGTWSLTVHATASDPESGIALAQLYSGRETVASMSFPERPARAELTFETARIPMPRPGIRNTGWQLRIFNGSFHEQAVPLAVTLPAGFTPGARIDLILPEATATVSEPVAMWARRRGPLEHGAPTEFRWDMGDGTRLAGERVEHAYSIPGVYKIALTAEFADGRTANAMDRIRIVER
ncbi:MAG: PKD domain-containing protein [Planctomycetota bacterium]